MKNQILIGKLGILAIAIASNVANAANSHGCVLEKTVGGDGSVQLVATSVGTFQGTLETVSAEVDTYGIAGDPQDRQFIGGMTLIDSRTGVRSAFSHNEQTVHNESPHEAADIQVGTLYMDLGVRGVFRLRCN